METILRSGFLPHRERLRRLARGSEFVAPIKSAADLIRFMT